MVVGSLHIDFSSSPWARHYFTKKLGEKVSSHILPSDLLNACVHDFMDLEMSLKEEKSLENVKVTGV